MVSSLQSSHERARLVPLPSPTLAQADDRTLARAACAGDPRATSVLWDRFSGQTRRILRRTLGPSAVVEPLVQRVFLRAVDDLGALPESAQLEPFFVALTARVAVSELKRERLRRLFRLGAPLSTDYLADADPAVDSALAALYRILDRLHPDARLAFTLRHFEGLSAAELASATGSSIASVKRRLARASTEVRSALAESPELGAYAAGRAGALR
jgi:RNA polymerase sigma-70 factor, ECF subfamily